ncbi:hypothetical protein PTTG_30794 [Puccinia triticina 1-1 BBBD Race 1]|uniref:Uncharacterized protein n=1 Tax=Puccinia triticina (isolate 1-1 / race 1 (BBBD)) TaxID=630390 RepID=A0A180FXV0_PUCT1|nr:hypothetical protein PTTG_30794 [Puccinia triticina 1-1 BBBD Race 1]
MGNHKAYHTVADYTHSFFQHASAAGWEVPTLISPYHQGLKGEIQMWLIVSCSTFATVNEFAKDQPQRHGPIIIKRTTLQLREGPDDAGRTLFPMRSAGPHIPQLSDVELLKGENCEPESLM